MAKAEWNGVILAESDDYKVVEGNVYFPPDSVQKEYLRSVPGKVMPITSISWSGAR
jgi:uncharacterized protein (DUF427 family)